MSEGTRKATTRVTDRGQTTIPKPIREKYGIEPGDEVVWTETDNGLLVQKRSEGMAGYGSFAEGFTEDERTEAANELTEELQKRRETEWAIE